ncbi:hypothetical protein [Pseudomonas phage vB_PaeM_PS3]|uniref:Uncharacterized protein n=5 Tax=Pakpunavirus TaxID=1921407 RepID=A0AAF0JPG6_9CAUD|nr:hypothetical protein PAK_P400132 [Pseudomonas phage PAK_P4]YP_010763417.1 hypothetical protein QE330_gp133 [Pseudomonas phage vB_Pae_Kat]YP_010763826.1 hypothetical protein QE332_gp108 [Pseudomonas phage vB_PaeM_LCK69]YP_010763993.1 hypothetical protein QE333_gp101 [Pseudomonas phage vB_PaeM_B31]YP_010764074.1 hypothetical protein QE337_gp008 [Pseudomonas phage HJ01]YP_010764840.1 hypothetical protein QE345_gp134 [Pseudomonas phage vB_PA45_GUMS]QAU05282.1 hypothetical protein S2_010 [Pseud
MNSNSIAPLIKEGMRAFFENEEEPYMCYILERLALCSDSSVTVSDVGRFKGWLDKTFGIGPLNSVMHLLDEVADSCVLSMFENNPPNKDWEDYWEGWAIGRAWCNFYVWAYFDLIRKGGE